MSRTTALSLLISILLTNCSQFLMKFGVTSDKVRAAIATGHIVKIITQVALSPWVVAGIACFGLSFVLWLFVLSRLNVSQAYPCVALGFVLTLIGGHFLFGEAIDLPRAGGLALIIAGVGIIALVNYRSAG